MAGMLDGRGLVAYILKEVRMDGDWWPTYGRKLGWMGTGSLHMAGRWDGWGLVAYI